MTRFCNDTQRFFTLAFAARTSEAESLEAPWDAVGGSHCPPLQILYWFFSETSEMSCHPARGNLRKR